MTRVSVRSLGSTYRGCRRGAGGGGPRRGGRRSLSIQRAVNGPQQGVRSARRLAAVPEVFILQRPHHDSREAQLDGQLGLLGRRDQAGSAGVSCASTSTRRFSRMETA